MAPLNDAPSHESRHAYEVAAELVEGLAVHVRSRQSERRMTQFGVAVAAGLPPSTLTRLHHGQGLSTVSIVRLLRWLAAPAGPSATMED
jgi:hypothetical protein